MVQSGSYTYFFEAEFPDINLVALSNNTAVVSMMTAYDYPTANAVSEAEIDIILVGDSLAQVVLGHEDTLSVTV